MYCTLNNRVEEMCNVGLSSTRCCKVHVERKDQRVKDATNYCADPDCHPHFRDRFKDVQVKDEEGQFDEP